MLGRFLKDLFLVWQELALVRAHQEHFLRGAKLQTPLVMRVRKGIVARLEQERDGRLPGDEALLVRQHELVAQGLAIVLC